VVPAPSGATPSDNVPLCVIPTGRAILRRARQGAINARRCSDIRTSALATGGCDVMHRGGSSAVWHPQHRLRSEMPCGRLQQYGDVSAANAIPLFHAGRRTRVSLQHRHMGHLSPPQTRHPGGSRHPLPLPRKEGPSVTDPIAQRITGPHCEPKVDLRAWLTPVQRCHFRQSRQRRRA
jgi:hypothetical protein